MNNERMNLLLCLLFAIVGIFIAGWDSEPFVAGAFVILALSRHE